MSHFTVMVLGPNPEEQLAPYQENNMGDCPHEYLEFHDKEDEHLKEYEEGATEKVVMPDGRLLKKWDDEFRKEGTFGIGPDTHEVPEGLEIRKVPFKELYSTFEEYMSDWCGYEEKDDKTGKYGYWENPNRKWDWYQLGGRWRGLLKLKSPNMQGTVGETSLVYPVEEKDGYCDQALKGQIDFEGMMDEAGEEAKDKWEKVENLFGGEIPKLEINWKKDMWDGGKYEDLDIDKKRELYDNQPGMLKLTELKEKIWNDKNNPDRNFLIWLDLDDYQCTKEEYIENARNNSFITFAVLKDGKWYEKGEMLMFAVVKDEKDNKEWCNQFVSLVMDLPDETLISIYDCHI